MLTNQGLTDVEKIVIESWSNRSDTPRDVNRDDSNLVNIKFFRDFMKETAHHEAGHLVAKMFTGLEFSHVKSVSIIPDDKYNGRVLIERPYTELLLKQMPVEIQRSQGYGLLLELFAGYGSVMTMENKTSEYKTLSEYLYWDLYVDEDDYADGSDLCRAERIAGILSRPHFSKDRILGMTANWTLEMLHIPAIWNAVETIAEMLISKGEITTDGNEEVFFNIRKELNVPRVTKIPKWSRRIYGK